MSTKLIQKHLFKSNHEYEIVDDQIFVRTKSRSKNETLSISLAVLNPEPVITRSHLNFVSRVNGEPLLSLSLSKPNVTEFNNFVHKLKQRAQTEYNAISGINVEAKPITLNGNSYDEPPEFNETTPVDISFDKQISVEKVANAISMLETYVKNDDIYPLIKALESLRQEPQNNMNLLKVANAFNELGSSQGAVLTYAPYISIMLSDSP